MYYFYNQRTPTRIKQMAPLLNDIHHGPDLSVPPSLIQVHLVAFVLVGFQHGQQRRGEVAAGLVLDDLLQVSLVLWGRGSVRAAQPAAHHVSVSSSSNAMSAKRWNLRRWKATKSKYYLHRFFMYLFFTWHLFTLTPSELSQTSLFLLWKVVRRYKLC